MKLTLVVLVPLFLTIAPLSAQANQAPEESFESIVQDIREREFRAIRGQLLSAASRMPEEHYSFRAAPEIRSFAEEIHHAADVNFRLCGLASADTDSGSQNEASDSTKRGVIGRLAESLDLCASSLAEMDDQSALTPTFAPYIRASHVIAMVGHCANVHGKMTLMMRLVGVDPAGDGE